MNDNLRLFGIPSKNVMHIWDEIVYLVKAALEYADNKYTLFDIQYAILNREMQLWVISDDDDVIQAIVVTQIVTYPHKKVMFFVLAAGVNSQEWLHFIKDFREFAKEHSCKSIECLGRSGWEKPFKSIGLKKVHTLYSLPI